MNENERSFARHQAISGFAPILVVIIFGLLAVVGYFILKSSMSPTTPSPTTTSLQTPTPTLDPTADWKTYTNHEVGFSLKYPSGWYLEKTSERRGAFNTDEIAIANWNFKTMFPEEAEVDPAIRLNITTSRTEIALAEFLKLQTNYEERYFEETIEIANIPGTKIKYPGLGNNITVTFRADEYIVFLNASDNIESENFLDQTLSTFEFIE